MQTKTKVAVIAFMFTWSFGARAFDQVVCTSDLDVRLMPRAGKPRMAPKPEFAFTKKDALELDLSIGETAIGQIFPWDHVVWQPGPGAAPAAGHFKDVKFKTDDATLFDLSLVTSIDKKPHELSCSFRLSK